MANHKRNFRRFAPRLGQAVPSSTCSCNRLQVDTTRGMVEWKSSSCEKKRVAEGMAMSVIYSPR